MKLSKTYPGFAGTSRDQLNDDSGQTGTKTLFTQEINGQVQLRPDRPGILFSSTSWTPDEDFSLLMEALQCKKLYFVTYLYR